VRTSNPTSSFVGRYQGRRPLGNVCLGKRLASWPILIICVAVDWLRLAEGPVAGSCKHGNETSGSVKRGKFLEQLSDCQLLKNSYAGWSELCPVIVYCQFASVCSVADAIAFTVKMELRIIRYSPLNNGAVCTGQCVGPEPAGRVGSDPLRRFPRLLLHPDRCAARSGSAFLAGQVPLIHNWISAVHLHGMLFRPLPALQLASSWSVHQLT
jgi:hypothetical protein